MRTPIKKILTTALCTCLISSFPLMSQSAGTDPDLTAGVSYVKNGDYKEGIPLLRRAVERSPDDPEANYYLGMALNRTAPDKVAESHLKRSLMEMPMNPAISYELGIHYYEKDVKAEAADYFEQVIELAPGSDMAAKSSAYLQKINERKPEKNWDLNIFAGSQYDSNVMLNGQGMPLPTGYSGKSDWSAIASMRGNYYPVKSEQADIGLGYSFYQNIHNKVSDFDVTQHVLELSGSYDLGDDYRIKGAYSFEYLLLDGKEYDFANSIAPSLIVKNDLGTTTVDYRYRNTSYRNSSQFQNNTDRDGYNHMIGATHILPLSDTTAIWGLYCFDGERTRKTSWDYYGNRFLAGLRSGLPFGTVGDLSGEVYLKDYRGFDPDFGATRHDTLYTLSISLQKNFTEQYGISITQVWNRNTSNIPDFTYERALTSLLLNAKF